MAPLLLLGLAAAGVSLVALNNKNKGKSVSPGNGNLPPTRNPTPGPVQGGNQPLPPMFSLGPNDIAITVDDLADEDKPAFAKAMSSSDLQLIEQTAAAFLRMGSPMTSKTIISHYNDVQGDARKRPGMTGPANLGGRRTTQTTNHGPQVAYRGGGGESGGGGSSSSFALYAPNQKKR